MKAKLTFTVSIVGAMLFAAATDAQNVNRPQPKTPPAKTVGNPAKPPPAVKALFIPDLRLRGSESVEINAVVPKSYHKITFSFSAGARRDGNSYG